MATQMIPVQNAAALGNFFYTVSLDGVDYELFYKYNRREKFWYIDVLDSEGNQVRSGIKIVGNYPLLRRCVVEACPPGEIMALDMRPEPQDPGLDDLGNDAVMVYEEEATVPR